jgi:hypothetical protein
MVGQTAIVDNTRVGHALSRVKVQQELKRETMVLTNSEKGGYKKRPRSVYGPEFIENSLAPKAVMTYKRQIRFAHPAMF